ncbi:MAG: prepilin-type N-terminal cleavage/methylation domain-containing protein [Nitrospinae bacterium]|nr:prepilin-type N-terminal cleavage/methylation domain-containing protein [Nitrospinota bacterium]
MRLLNRSRPAKGYTLVELVVTMAILGFIGLGVSGYFSNALGLYLSAALENNISEETGAALERISRELQSAAPQAPGGEAVSSPARGASSSTLTINRPSAMDCVACVDKSAVVTFNLNQAYRALYRTTAQSGPVVLTDNVTSFSVTASDDSPELRHFTISITREKNGAQAVMETSVFPPGTRDLNWREVIR